MDSLIERVIAARKAAEAANTPADGAPRSEAQHAAILIAQVQAILGYSAPVAPAPIQTPGPDTPEDTAQTPILPSGPADSAEGLDPDSQKDDNA